MEVTKWLKPSECASRIGDGASVQAATRVNAEQNSRALRPGKNLGYAVALSESIHPFFDVAVSSLPFA
jgi:hypothetical protein